MEKINAVIFDMDGTLYQFPNGTTFSSSPLGEAVKENVTSFIAEEFKLQDDEARLKYRELQMQYDGEMSLGLEQEFGIDRMSFFEETWGIDPENVIVPEPNLKDELAQLSIRCALLTSAPRVWATRVLGYIDVINIFDDLIFTGEPDIRKPNPEVFRAIAKILGLDANQIVSIGDQEYSDIIPAKEVGMRTVRIGKDVQTDADFIAPNVRSALAILRQEGLLV
jgi:phosphoglycolate phosphatase